LKLFLKVRLSFFVLFIGKRELFKDCWIGDEKNVPKKWWDEKTGVPVLRFEIPLYESRAEYKSNIKDDIRDYYEEYKLS